MAALVVLNVSAGTPRIGSYHSHAETRREFFSRWPKADLRSLLHVGAHSTSAKGPIRFLRASLRLGHPHAICQRW